MRVTPLCPNPPLPCILGRHTSSATEEHPLPANAPSPHEPKGLSLYESRPPLQRPLPIRRQAARRRKVDANGLQFHYLEWGSPGHPTLLMLHGICQQAHSWDFISLALAHQYHVHRPRRPRPRRHPMAPGRRLFPRRPPARSRRRSRRPEPAKLHPRRPLDGADATATSSPHAVPTWCAAWSSSTPAPDRSAAGSRRIRNFITLPDRLNSYEEFVERVMEYTGRPAWMVHGSLQHTIRETSDGKWTWKYDAAIRSPNFQPQSWPSEKLWKCLANLQCPTLAVRGANTDVLSEEVFQRMQRTIPNCQIATVEKAGHLVPRRQPTRLPPSPTTLPGIPPLITTHTLPSSPSSTFSSFRRKPESSPLLSLPHPLPFSRERRESIFSPLIPLLSHPGRGLR